MSKIKSIKSAGFFPVTFVALLYASIQTLSAQEKPVLNRTVLLENRVELPGKNINAKIIRVEFPPAFKTPRHTHEGPGPRYIVKGKLRLLNTVKPTPTLSAKYFGSPGILCL